MPDNDSTQTETLTTEAATTETPKTWQEQRAEGKAALLTLGAPIKAAGYRFLVAYFDGSGDEGQLGKIVLCRSAAEEAVSDSRYEGEMDEGDELPAPLTAVLSQQAIEDALWSVIPDCFEDNAGGYGAVILDAETQTLKVNYSYRVEESVADDYEV